MTAAATKPKPRLRTLCEYSRMGKARRIVMRQNLVLDVAPSGPLWVVAILSDSEGIAQAEPVLEAGGYVARAAAGERGLCRRLTRADLGLDEAPANDEAGE